MKTSLLHRRGRHHRDGSEAPRCGIQSRAGYARNAGWLLLLVAWSQAFGQVSVLDTSFQVGSGANATVEDLVVQADQRILVGGEFTAIAGCSNSYLARLHSDGSVDTAFNPAGQTDGPVQCLLQQPDGKVLVAGQFHRLLGQVRPTLARLLEDGAVDAAFDASTAFQTNDSIFSLALQPDGRVLVGYRTSDDGWSRVVRLNTNGLLDSTFVCTNLIGSYIFALLPQPDGSVLCGGNPNNYLTGGRFALFRLRPDGQFDEAFDAGLDVSSVFCLVRQASGQILVGGLLNRTGFSNSPPVLRLTSDLHWDESFKPDAFSEFRGPPYTTVYALLPQPDGKIVVGGSFFEVGGYWRRNIVRLTSEGHVDGCFDPGLGLAEGSELAPARTMALQSDGRILVGGWFWGADTAARQQHVARLLPQSACNSTRVYLNPYDYTVAIATFPAGGTNYLEMSNDLTSWQTVQTNTHPYIWYIDFSLADAPRAFFRARQER